MPIKLKPSHLSCISLFLYKLSLNMIVVLFFMQVRVLQYYLFGSKIILRTHDTCTMIDHTGREYNYTL